jgi:hypothetical protein
MHVSVHNSATPAGAEVQEAMDVSVISKAMPAGSEAEVQGVNTGN